MDRSHQTRDVGSHRDDPAPVRVLVVEDDPGVADALCESLSLHGLSPTHVSTGLAALELASSVDLVLLDLGLPDLDGLEVCRRIRHVSSVPIIAVTARADEIDRVLGLKLGADDYVVKPYGQRELLARIEAVLRRSRMPSLLPTGMPDATRDSVAEPPVNQSGSHKIRIGDLEFDERSHRVWVVGEPVSLARKEFAILALLVREPGALVTRETLIATVWGGPWHGPTRTIDVHVSSLRQKLGIADFIQTVRGVGYRIDV